MSAGQVVQWLRYVGNTDVVTVLMRGATLPLTGGETVTARVVRDGVAVSCPAAVTDTATGEITVTLTAWLAAAEEGTYLLYVTMDDLTWPDVGRAEIEVKALPTPA